MAAPTNYVLKVYTTKKEALAGETSTALQVIGSGNDASTIDLGSNSTLGFWTHTKYYYRLETNAPVSKMYIDWDDGEDNFEKANYSELIFKTPQSFGIFEHVYTQHRRFFPLIKTTSVEGLDSKYYTSGLASLLGIHQVVTLGAVGAGSTLDGDYFIIYDGNNVGYYVWIDENGSAGTIVDIPDGYISVEVTTVVDADTDAQAATKIAAVINALDEFTGASGGTTTLTITNATAGNCKKAEAGNSGFTVTVTTYGDKNDITELEESHETPLIGTRKVWIDSTSNERIPSLAPANVPPVGILKTDRVQLFSGIDNSVIPSVSTPRGFCYLDGTHISKRGADADISNAIEVTFRTTSGRVLKEICSVTTYDGATGKAKSGVLFPAATGDGYLKEVLEVRLLNLLEDTTDVTKIRPDERIHLLVYDNTSNPTSPYQAGGSDTITMVSQGNPQVYLKKPSFYTIADGSESYARNSNSTIKNYYFEDGKLTSMNTPITAGGSIQASDKLDTTTQKNSTKFLSYTFDMNKGDQIDSNDRFFPVERLVRLQVRDSSEDTKVSDDDTFDRSVIEHFNSVEYITPTHQPSWMTSQSLLLYYNNSTAGGPTWTNVGIGRNLTNNTIVCGGAAGTDYSITNLARTAIQFPQSFLLAVKDKVYNKMHFRVDNVLKYGESINDAPGGVCKLVAWYSTSSGWKPLSFIDNTVTEKRNSDGSQTGHSLHTSGSITFDAPTDWLATTSRKITIDGGYGAANIISDIVNNGTSGTDDPHDLWTFDGYALLIGLIVEAELTISLNIAYTQTYDNNSSKVIKIVDPMHISLNSLGIISGITLNRRGSYTTISDRVGRDEIRKIGASGGSITLNGVDFPSTGERAKAVDYQKNSVPVYYDYKRPDNSYIRFYGVVTSLTEIANTGGAHPKFNMNLSISSVIEFASTGNWEDILSLGGKVENDPSYIL